MSLSRFPSPSPSPSPSPFDTQLDSLSSRDSRSLWHPYSQHGLKRSILPVVSASGAYLKLEDGREILDGISSWWVNLHGHAHPKISRAIADQCERLEHVLFAGFTHEPAVRLAEILLQAANQAGGRFSRAFYSDNGSTAIEVALKMAYQFHFNRGETGRTRFLALRGSYHGDTLGAMAVGEPEGFHTLFRRLLPQVDFIEPDDLEALIQRVDRSDCPYAAFIFEPLIQGAGGMRTYSAEFLKKGIEVCRSRNVLTIADEVFTGFYRTGTCFAFEQVRAAPDLLCLSKGISGGFLPLAVTLATSMIFDAFYSQDLSQAFLHGHSYTANPLACAAALESWAILHSDPCQSRLQMIQRITSERLTKAQEGGWITRGLGTIGAIQLGDTADYFDEVTIPSGIMAERAISRGVLLRPLGNVLYTVPPYCVTTEELHRIYDVMEELLQLS